MLLGDAIEKVTTFTGIKKVVKSISKDCGCDKRKKILNNPNLLINKILWVTLNYKEWELRL